MSIITTYSKTSEYCPLVQYKDAAVPIYTTTDQKVDSGGDMCYRKQDNDSLHVMII